MPVAAYGQLSNFLSKPDVLRPIFRDSIEDTARVQRALPDGAPCGEPHEPIGCIQGITTRGAIALVIEGDREAGGFVQTAVEAEGFEARVKRSPQAAIDTLVHLDPVLAVVDWHAPGPGQVSDTLRVLAVRHSATLVIVVSGGLNDASVRSAISTAHPGALMHDQQAAADSLRLRIRGVLGRPFGDLLITHGVVVHIPCGRPFRHPIAAQLVGARGRAVLVRRSSPAAQAVFRFQKFLLAHGSPMRVVASGKGFRCLVDTRTLLPVCRAGAGFDR